MLKLVLILPLLALTAQAASPGQPYDRAATMKKYARPVATPHPRDNQPSAERELLGRTLFFDPRISGSGWISCASCHNPGLSWGDGLPRAIGHGMKVLDRRTPTILNLAWAELQFWDGRADSLEEQALGPMQAPGEMNGSLDQIMERIGSIGGYRQLFEAAYPGEGVTAKVMAKAIANFERTVVSGQAPFDRWLAGDATAISPEAQRGFDLFNTKANCAACHSGWSFTDHGFHDIGIKTADIGRGKLLKLEAMQYAHKTPTLRNVDQRFPYLHDGSAATLEDVIDLYDRGGDVARPSLSPDVRKLELTPADKKALVAFLKTLTSVDPPVRLPVLPR